MSPASSGTLEVERYIGACLISSQGRSKGATLKSHGRDSFFQPPRYVHNNHHSQRCRSVDGWAGGMPLISFANYQRRGKISQDVRMQEQHNPLSRLAVHTQGAPLILTNRYNQRKNKPPGKGFVHARGSEKIGKSKDAVQGADTISVNSDESSTSTNSENSLPRIIKPRKRRKKDRKPPHLNRSLVTDDCFSTDSASPDIDSPSGIVSINSYLPFTFEQFNYPHSDSLGINNVRNDNNTDLISLSKLKLKTDIHEIPELHHSFEDVKDFSKDINDNQPASSCQCRYCDPSGQIWDVDRHCYSPFLTTPKRQNSFSFPDIQAKPLISSLCTDLVEAISTLSLDSKRANSDSSISGSLRDLEVSTEIVTSHNGHRDLEIKFFSSPLTPEISRKGTARTISLEEYRSKSDIDESGGVNNTKRLNFEQ